jgi:hypothetical protein
MNRWISIVAALILTTGCGKPLLNPPSVHETTIVESEQNPVPVSTPKIAFVKATPTPSTTPSQLLGNPEGPTLTKAGNQVIIQTAFTLSKPGQDLVEEFEVGGKRDYNPRPEAPDARYSGITWGIGYDAHQNSPSIIVSDWMRLGEIPAKKLSNTHPYYGVSAQNHLKDVHDIIIPWNDAVGVFDLVDVARTYSKCKKVFPGFENLRLNAQAALISLVFNRGDDMTGGNRIEMRDIRDYGIPTLNYERIASNIRKMERIWRGTQIEKGMTRRREAEAKLVLTP